MRRDVDISRELKQGGVGWIFHPVIKNKNNIPPNLLFQFVITGVIFNYYTHVGRDTYRAGDNVCSPVGAGYVDWIHRLKMISLGEYHVWSNGVQV